MHHTTRPVTLIANVRFSFAATTGFPSVVSLRQSTDVVKFPDAPAVFDPEPKMGSYRLNNINFWCCVECWGVYGLWESERWKRKLVSSMTVGFMGVVLSTLVKTVGWEGGGFFFSEIQCHYFWKISHTICFSSELPSIDWTRNFFSLSPYFCPQMSDFALFSWFIFSSFVHFWRLSALCWR